MANVEQDLQDSGTPLSCVPPVVQPVSSELLGQLETARPDQSSVDRVSPEVQAETGLDRYRALSEAQAPPALPTSGPGGSLQRVLSRSDSALVYSEFADLNRLHRLAADANTERNRPLELLATRTALQAETALIKLRHGTNINLTAKLTSQADVPPWMKIPQENRDKIVELLNVTDVEAIDEFVDYSDADDHST